MYIDREIESRLKKLAGQFPIVTVYGPRQSGKTTAVRHAFAGYAYANLENPAVRETAVTDPEGFFKKYGEPLIIDEVQRVPELLSWLQVKADESSRRGLYIITGSHQPLLSEKISQSLAGRTAIARLFPLSWREMQAGGLPADRDRGIYSGFMPGVVAQEQEEADFFDGYYTTYVERDLRQLINVENLTAFETFLRLLAGRVGQILNLSALSRDVGVDARTLERWLSILEASFIVFRLPPYYSNFGKRFVKQSKLYFTDVGLAAWLLRIHNPKQVDTHPLFGALFENMVVMEALKWRHNSGKQADFYFMRDHAGLEVDLVAEMGKRLELMEIKGTYTPRQEDGRHLKAVEKLVTVPVSRTIVYSGEEWPLSEGGKFVNFASLAWRLDELYIEAQK